MSYDIHYNGLDDLPLDVPSFEDGGTYVLGGSRQAELNVTSNYSKLFAQYFHEDGIGWIDGKTGKEALPYLKHGLAILGQVPDEDYWKSTPGNAGLVLKRLVLWAELNPAGTFEIIG